MNSLEQLLSTELGIQSYVEAELTRELDRVPVVWGLTNVGRIERSIEQQTWAWTRETYRKLTWRVRSPGFGGVELYYELMASGDLQAFLLTHSNYNAGLYDVRWMIRTAKIIPFKALFPNVSLLRSEPLSLGRILSEVCLQYEPNCDWPT